VAVCYSTFPHFHDKPRALRNLSNLLKVGGTIYICHTASKEAINQIHHNITGFQDHLLPENKETRQLLADAGFTDISIEDKEEYYLVSATNQNHKN
jgi:demethylmenaquinone methyltransferase/2-methoxy-6-polyprenyl-1,4-benzoquinol methylase